MMGPDEFEHLEPVSVKVFGSHGRYRPESLSTGDVGYIPQDYGHAIENVGDQLRFL